MLLIAADEMHRGTPGVQRQRLQTSQGIDANDRRVSGQRSIGDCAQGRAAVSTLQFLQLSGTALELNESFLSR